MSFILALHVAVTLLPLTGGGPAFQYDMTGLEPYPTIDACKAEAEKEGPALRDVLLAILDNAGVAARIDVVATCNGIANEGD